MGMVVSLIMGLLWYYILQQYDNLAIPNALYQCLSVLAVTLVSLFVLNEKLTTTKMVGIFVCIIGLSLIQL
jgi:drug/metabolite transporter (DMT)-like permease